MTTTNEMFAGNPLYNIFGVVTGTASVTYFPSGSAKLIRWKADPDNIGTFKLGAIPVDETFFPLDAGDDTGWVAPPSAQGNLLGLNSYCYSNGSGSSDFLYFWLQR